MRQVNTYTGGSSPRYIRKHLQEVLDKVRGSVLEDKKKMDGNLEMLSLANDVAAILARNTIISGGCISSMLLGETVNDYDIYFKSIEDAQTVATYYCKRFLRNENMPEEVSSNRTGKRRNLIEVLREPFTNLRGEQEERVRLYIKSVGILETERTDLLDEGDLPADPTMLVGEVEGAYEPVCVSQNAITLNNGIQLIFRFAGEPDKIHDTYDFAHAMNYFADNKLTLNQEALEALLEKRLIYKGSLYPLCSLFRAKKFIKRGWKISAGELLKIAVNCSKIDYANMTQLADQLMGVDVVYMNYLISELREITKKSEGNPMFVPDRDTMIERITETVNRIWNGEDEELDL